MCATMCSDCDRSVFPKRMNQNKMRRTSKRESPCRHSGACAPVGFSTHHPIQSIRRKLVGIEFRLSLYSIPIFRTQDQFYSCTAGDRLGKLGSQRLIWWCSTEGHLRTLVVIYSLRGGANFRNGEV